MPSASLLVLFLVVCCSVITSLVLPSMRRVCSAVRIPCGLLRGQRFYSSESPSPSTIDNCSRDCAIIEKKMLKSIVENNLNDTNMLLCVSGGSDSVAMMHVFEALQRKKALLADVHVVNFNHKMRPESDEEAEFIGNLARKFNMPFYAKELPQSIRTDVGFQEAARNWRRQESRAIVTSLQRPGREDGKDYVICTAHTHDDQMETLMLKFVRGVHITNFQGMQQLQRGFFKPLLSHSKAELVKYLTCRGASWREDSSNTNRKYKRNHVRLDLMPLLEQLTGGKHALASRLENLSKQSSELREWIDKEAKIYDAKLQYVDNPSSAMSPHILNITTVTAQSIPRLVLGELLHRWVVIRTGVEPSTERMEHFVDMVVTPLGHGVAFKTATISNDWDVKCLRNALHLVRRQPQRVSSVK